MSSAPFALPRRYHLVFDDLDEVCVGHRLAFAQINDLPWFLSVILLVCPRVIHVLRPPAFDARFLITKSGMRRRLFTPSMADFTAVNRTGATASAALGLPSDHYAVTASRNGRLCERVFPRVSAQPTYEDDWFHGYPYHLCGTTTSDCFLHLRQQPVSMHPPAFRGRSSFAPSISFTTPPYAAVLSSLSASSR